jgi:hypothetical protein
MGRRSKRRGLQHNRWKPGSEEKERDAATIRVVNEILDANQVRCK